VAANGRTFRRANEMMGEDSKPASKKIAALLFGRSRVETKKCAYGCVQDLGRIGCGKMRHRIVSANPNEREEKENAEKLTELSAQINCRSNE